MTKSRGVGRGGLRSNPGGRPSKAKPPAEPMTAVDGDPAQLAMLTLTAIMTGAAFPPAARVSAAKAVLAMNSAKAAPAGKKQQAAAAATAAGLGGAWGDDLTPPLATRRN
jgi:hypothetical protein